jgi:glycine betaine/proline transport system ATP-binding protein
MIEHSRSDSKSLRRTDRENRTPAIKLDSIYKIFGSDENKGLHLLNTGVHHRELNKLGFVVALNDITLSVSPGDIYVVMGLSGSGKSTLVRCINRLIDPTAGRVSIEGEDITHLSAKDLRQIRMRKLAMVFQRFALFPHMTVLDNIGFGLRVMGLSRKVQRERASETLHLVGLDGWGGRKPRQLSGGMQQRVGLARALAMDAPILLMDEPFGSLDPLLREEMQQELLRLQNRLRKTIVFITHDLAEAITVGNRIAIVRTGQIVQEDDPAQIVLNPSDGYVEAFVRDVNVLKILTARQAADHSLPVLREGLPLPSKALNPTIVVDGENRPIKVLWGSGVASIERSTSTNTNGHVALNLYTIDLDQKIMPHLPIIARNEQLIILIDREGRYQGTINGQSVVRAIVHAKRLSRAIEGSDVNESELQHGMRARPDWWNP